MGMDGNQNEKEDPVKRTGLLGICVFVGFL